MKKRILCFLLAMVTVLSVFPAMMTSAEEQAEDSSAAEYDYQQFYVTDGLAFLLDAMSPNEETVDVENGMWYASLGKSYYYADLVGDSSYYHTDANGKGIGFHLTYAQRGAAVGFDLGIDALPADSYTVEYTAAIHGITNADGTRYVDSTSQYGYNYENGMAFGPLKQLTMPCARLSGKDGNMEMRWLYRAEGSYAANGYKCLVVDKHLAGRDVNYISSESITYAVTDGESGKTAKYSLYSHKSTVATMNIAAADFVEKDASDGYFRLFYSFPATVYSVRVYDRVLTEGERNVNHFADLCGYYGLNVNAFSAVPEMSRARATAALGAAFADVTFADSANTSAYQAAASAAQTLFDKTVADFVACRDTYIDLYVSDGLVALFDAHSATAGGTVTTWTPVILAGAPGYDSYLPASAYTLVGAWTAADGAYYSNGAGTALNLSAIGAKVGTTWSVQTVTEVVSLNAPLVSIDANGVVTNYATLAAAGSWGTLPDGEFGYNTYGPLDLRHIGVPTYLASNYNTMNNYFVQLVAPNATGVGSRIAANVFFCNAAYGQVQKTYSLTDAAGTTTKVTAWESEWPSAVLEQTVARLGSGVVGSATTAISWKFTYQFAPSYGAGQTISGRSFNYTSYAVTDSTALTVFAGKKANNYSARVYNKELTDAEINQNHLADICGYYDLDLSDLLAMPAEHRDAAIAALAATFAPVAMNGKTTAAEAQKMLDQATNHYLYLSLYESDGLEALYLAYPNATTADVASGYWSDLVDGDTATLKGTWKNGANGGIYYNLSGANTGYGIDLGIAQLPTSDYTVETVGSVKGFTQNADGVNQVVSTKEYGVYAKTSSFAFGPLKMHIYGSASTHAAPVLHWQAFRFMYGDGDLDWYAHNAAYGDWGGDTITSLFYKDPTVMSLSMTLDYTADTAYTYTFYKDLKQVQTYTEAKNGGSCAPIAPNDTQPFRMYTGIGSSVYAIRIYKGVLTETQRENNYAIDVLAFYGMDIAPLFDLEETARASALSLLNAFCLNVEMDESNYAVYRAEVRRKYYYVMESLGAELEPEVRENNDSHLSLYVSDGLAILLDAMSPNEETVDVENGMWYASLGKSYYYADLVGDSSYYHTDANGKGIGFHLTYAQRGAAVGFDLGIDALPADSYTVEYTAAIHGITNADGTRYVDSTSQYGYNYENGMAFGPLKQLTMPCARLSGKDGNMEMRWLYRAEGSYAANSYKCLVKDMHLAGRDVNYISSESITYAVTDGESGKTAKYSLYSHKSTVATMNIAAADFVEKDASDGYFRLFYSFPATVYSVRVYNRVLTEAERKQNHFADMIGYYGFDVSSFYDGLTAEEKTALHEAFFDYDFTATSDEIWQLLASYYLSDTDLYVTDGLRFNATAFHTAENSADIANGRWYNSFSDEYATLIGAEYWSRKTDGLGYGLVFAQQDAKVGLSLPASLLSDAYTLEITADIIGLREDNGGKTGDASTFDHSVDYTLALGALKLKQWNTPVDSGSMSYPTKWYYAPGTGTTYETASETFSLSTALFSPEVDGIRSLAVTRTLSDTTDTYGLWGNGVSLGTLSATAEEGDEELLLFYQMPVTVYAVRVYNRVLSEAELAQNRFADMVYYYGLDITALEEVENKAAVYTEMSGYGFDMTAVEAQAVLDMILGDVEAATELAIEYDGLSARLSGDNSGIRSLYSINHRMIAALETRYNVAYGAITGIGETANGTVNTTGGLAVNGSFAEGYTAATSNSACVTVYATDMPAYATGMTINGGDGFAYTTILSDATENETYYNLGMVYAGFLALTDKETGEQQIVYYRAEGSLFGSESSVYGASTSLSEIAYYFVNQYNGTNAKMVLYNSSARLRGILYACGYTEEDIRTVINEAELLAQRKAELAAMMETNTADYPVLIAGEDAAPANGAKAIWVQYLPELDPYASSTLADQQAIKAVYFYYPMNADPADYTDDQLVEMGAVRVFAYLGLPTTATAQAPAPGIVCVHGGGGHAYAAYCLTAVRNGYAAIAFDTEGTHRTVDSTVDANSAYVSDPVGHKAKDSFSTAREAIDTQWMYYAISDAAFANTILRSLDAVATEKVGITGISWGGLTTQIATNYDSRYAFAVPVYLSNYLGYGDNTAQFSSIRDSFAADLWQDEDVLRANTVPTLILNSEKDLWADVNSSVRTYETMRENNPNVYLVIKPSLLHSQQEGAGPAEIYRFGKWVLSGYADEYAFITPTTEVKKQLGRVYTLQVTVPENLTSPTATLYYTTEAITYGAGGVVDQTFYSVSLDMTATGETKDGLPVYTVTVEIPDTAYLYYISFHGTSAADAAIVTPYDWADKFKGLVYSSTSIIVLGEGEING